MRHLLLFFSFLFVLGCSDHGHKIKPRLAPVYKGIDARAYPLISDYVLRAKKHHVRFTKPISIGFTDINNGGVVGTCFYGKNFREIEIDNHEWFSHTELNREELIFHELTHCLCSRRHDYADGKEYTPIPLEKLDQIFHDWPFYAPLPGRYKDECPLSIMFPHVLSLKCIKAHREEYLNEMFDRCKPW